MKFALRLGRIAVAMLALALCAPAAVAQSTLVYQSGLVTPGDLAKFLSQGRIGDAGGINGDANGVGFNPFSVTGPGLDQCFRNAVPPLPNNSFCLGFSGNNGLLSVAANNGATPGGLDISLNGQPAVLATLILPATSGHAACISGTLGGISDCGGLTGTGTVTSVALSLPNIFTVTGSPVTSGGTLAATLANQSANTIFAGPASGSAAAPSFRAMAEADLGALAGLPYVDTNAALAATASTAFTRLLRLGYHGFSDAPALLYKASSSACSLFSGAGDGGSQVRSSDGKCWLGVFPEWIDVRQFGAWLDGSDDDTTADQNAINYGATQIILFPKASGAYSCVPGGLTVTAGSPILLGENSAISACAGNADALYLNSTNSVVRDLIVFGPQMQSGAVPAGDAVHFGSQCVTCFFDHSYAVFGKHAFENEAVDAFLTDAQINNGYGTSALYNTDADFYQLRNKIDQGWPVCTPNPGLVIVAWQQNHNYTGTCNTVVTPAGWILQNPTTGTSNNGSAPAAANYGTLIPDGMTGLSWYLVDHQGYYSEQFDSGSSGSYEWGGDHTGAFYAGIGLTDAGIGGPPGGIVISSTGMGGNIYAGFDGAAGSAVQLDQMGFGTCVGANCAAVLTENAFAGDLEIQNVLITGSPYGVLFNAGSNLSLDGGLIFGTTIGAVQVAANLSKINISNVKLGGSTTYGPNATTITFVAGSGDHIHVVNNILAGATVPAIAGLAGLTGTDLTVWGNK